MAWKFSISPMAHTFGTRRAHPRSLAGFKLCVFSSLLLTNSQYVTKFSSNCKTKCLHYCSPKLLYPPMICIFVHVTVTPPPPPPTEWWFGFVMSDLLLILNIITPTLVMVVMASSKKFQASFRRDSLAEVLIPAELNGQWPCEWVAHHFLLTNCQCDKIFQ